MLRSMAVKALDIFAHTVALVAMFCFPVFNHIYFSCLQHKFLAKIISHTINFGKFALANFRTNNRIKLWEVFSEQLPKRAAWQICFTAQIIIHI